jgi:2-polyprenyl-6-hydroxyphenyl methylase/3-demethylubiquinone-9 3-methyltransferase
MLSENTDLVFQNEIANGERFQFGENWASFLKLLNENRIKESEISLCKMLGIDSFENKTFLDIGSGSGLFSLAAKNMGAKVSSFDYDSHSVACTLYLKNKFYPDDDSWKVYHASVLDKTFMDSLPQFDYVYSWGVLHHTGKMYQAITIAADKVKPGGLFYIALYRKTIFDKFWKKFKKFYAGSGKTVQFIFQNAWVFKSRLAFLIKGKSFKKMRATYQKDRGMDFYKDIHDWLGGYPYEAITPAECRFFLQDQKFELVKQKILCEGVSKSISSGCDEFLFKKI